MRALLFVMVVFMLVAVPPQSTCAVDPAQRLVTIHANNTRLADVLDILSEKSSLNIVAAAEVEDKLVSINLRETPVEEALNLIVRAAGLGYERVGNSVLVAETTALQQETGVSTYVIPLEFADAFELVPVVEKMVTNVAADPGGNRLVVVATPGMIEQIKSVIKELDVAPVQIMLETEVIEVSTSDLEEYGIDWSKITKQSVILTEGDHEASSTDGIPAEMDFVSAHLNADNIYHQAEALEVALDLLETEGKARVLTRARLATLNNRKAEIHIGDVIPYTVTGLTTGGVYEVKVEKSEVGVSFAEIFNYDPKTDRVKKTDVPSQKEEELASLAGITINEIRKEKADKKMLLEYLIKNKVTSFSKVQEVVQRYYVDPDSVLSH